MPARHPAGLYQRALQPRANTGRDLAHRDKPILRPCSGNLRCLFKRQDVSEQLLWMSYYQPLPRDLELFSPRPLLGHCDSFGFFGGLFRSSRRIASMIAPMRQRFRGHQSVLWTAPEEAAANGPPSCPQNKWFTADGAKQLPGLHVIHGAADGAIPPVKSQRFLSTSSAGLTETC